MLSQADIVKKGPLKYKASKIKGTSGANIQGPKTYKEFYMVFRSIHGGHKVMEGYQSEKKFQEVLPPKLTVDLDEAISVQIMTEKKNFFFIEMTDGVMCFFEAKTPTDAQEWKNCLNAVLLVRGPEGDGILQYDVDVLEANRLPYQGPAILELREKEGDLTIWTRDIHEQVVRWKLAHIRSFKAKKSTLTIYPGSRSSTGAREFQFGCTNSVQVTHAIETIVAMLKTKKQRARRPATQDSQQPATDRRPLPNLPSSRPPPSLSTLDDPNHIAIPALLEYNNDGNPEIQASIAANIPHFNPLDVYEDISEGERQAIAMSTAGEEYHKLKHTKKLSHGAANTTMPPPPEYGRLNVENKSSLPVPSRTSPNISRKRFDYEEIPDPPPTGSSSGTEEHKVMNRAISSPAAAGAFKEEYRRLDRQKSPVRGLSPPQKPPPYKPKEPLLAPSDALYSQIDDRGTKVRPSTVRYRERSPAVKASLTRSNSNPDLISKDEYRALNHFDTDRKPLTQPEEYGKLDHQVQKKKKVPLPPPAKGLQKEEYGKLDHAGHHPDEYGKLDHAGHHPEEYGKLDHTPVGQPEEYGKLDHGPPRQPEEYGKLDHGPPRQPEEYGKLDHGPPRQPEEYGKLDHGAAKQPEEYGKLDHAARPPEEYGKLEHRRGFSLRSQQPKDEYRKLNHASEDQVDLGTFEHASCESSQFGRFKHASSTSPPKDHIRQSTFDPYGTLTAEELEETMKTAPSANIAKDKPTNLPIYTEIDQPNAAPIYSEVDNTRKASRKKHSKADSPPAPPPGYENTELKKPETAAYKASYKGANSPVAPPVTPPRSHAQKLKHKYVNIDGPVIPPERQRSGNASMTNGHTESTEVYDDIVNQNGTHNGGAPVPPQRGVSMQSPVMEDLPTSTKPCVAQKPKVKPKPKLK